MKIASSENGGFTLAETAVASAVVAIIMISVVMGSNILQRTFAGSDGSLKAGADQSRALDYVARDVHQALTASVTNCVSGNCVTNGGETLTLTIPAYLDPNTGLPVIPTVTSSQVNYGSAASPVTVTYFPANASTPYTYQTGGTYLIRQVCLNDTTCAPGASGAGVTQTVISLDCTNLQINFTDLSSSTQVSIQTNITYAPRFNFDSAASTRVTNARAGTALYATAISKNPKR
jgi:hypothetical protein